MAEDLGQDIGEWLLNHKSEMWGHIKNFSIKAKNALDEQKKAAGIADRPKPNDVLKLDFDTQADAEGVSELLDRMGIENKRVAASIMMTRANTELAADWIEYVAPELSEDLGNEPTEKTTEKHPQVTPDPERKIEREEEPERFVNTQAQGFRPATPKQLEYMGNLHRDGFIEDKEYPHDLGNFSTRDADALIKRGRKRADEARGIERVRDSGEQAKAASKRLAQEKASQSRDRGIEQVLSR